MKTANKIIQAHYGLNRPVTDTEVIDELVNLRRKCRKGNLDDMQERLLATLQTAGMIEYTAVILSKGTKPMKTIAKLNMRDVDTFTRAYIDCAMWSSNDDNGEPLDRYDWTDLADETLQRMVYDCAKFQAEQDLTGYPSKNAGHDFWLTRNGHGAGFWENDFGSKEQCQKLTEASKRFGGCDLYVGDDGRIYI